MAEKYLVIGSNSFSGSHFVSRLLHDGNEVLGMSRSVEPHDVFLPYKRSRTNQFSFHKLDINEDLNKIKNLLDEFQPSHVVNFASQSMVAESWLHPEDWFRTNVLSNVMLHEYLRHAGYLKKYIHISTPEVYGSCSGCIKENTSYNPSTPYAVSRAAADMNLMALNKAYKFPVVFTRAANVYGPGQQLYRIIPKTILFFMMGKKIQLHGGGNSVRSFIHIDDVVDGTVRLAKGSYSGEIFHFSTQKNISIKSLVEIIAKKMCVSFDENVEISDERLGKDDAYLLDSSKARSVLNWADNISLEDGIDQTIAWVRNNLEVLRSGPFEYIHRS